eukprot:IDg12857t1
MRRRSRHCFAFRYCPVKPSVRYTSPDAHVPGLLFSTLDMPCFLERAYRSKMLRFQMRNARIMAAASAFDLPVVSLQRHALRPATQLPSVLRCAALRCTALRFVSPRCASPRCIIHLQIQAAHSICTKYEIGSKLRKNAHAFSASIVVCKQGALCRVPYSDLRVAELRYAAARSGQGLLATALE